MLINLRNLFLFLLVVFPAIALADSDGSEYSRGDRCREKADLESRFPIGLYKLLQGFEPERYDARKIVIFPGVLSDMSGNLAVSKSRIVLDVETLGVSGVDDGTFADGTSYHLYIVRDNRDCSVSGILSKQVSASKVALPEYAKVLRKLPWGIVPIKGEIPAFHLAYWPLPFTRFTDAASTPQWAALTKGDRSDYTEVDFSKWIPENARLIYLMIEVDAKGTGPGTAVLRVSGSKSEGLVVGRVHGGSGTMLTLHQRITSGKKLMYRVTGDAILTIYVLGYSNTEPS